MIIDLQERREKALAALEARIAELTPAEEGWFVVEVLEIIGCNQMGCGVAHYAPHAVVVEKRVRVKP